MSTLVKTAEARFRRHWAEAQRLGRLAVGEAWNAGKDLVEIKSTIAHGQWLDWLEVEGVAHSTAKRLMRLAEIQKDQIGLFETIDAALKAIPAPEPKGKPRPARPAPPKPDPVLSPAEEKEVWLESEAAAADTLRTELAEAKDQIDVMEKSGGDSAKGMVARSDYEKLKKEYSETWDLLKKRDRRIQFIKRSLLNGQTADEVLSRHFGLTRV